MKRYKESCYNIDIFSDDKNCCLWNSKTGAIIEFESALYKLISSNRFDDAQIIPLIPELLKQGIIVDKNLNEFNELYFRSKQSQLNTSQEHFSLVIAPTLACNYNCEYCFEKKSIRKNIMTPEVMEAIILLLKNRLKRYPTTKKFEVHWFGGEPLLAYDNVVLPLLKEFYSICRQNNIELVSRMTTNGYYLTSEKFNDLVNKYNLASVQITFDGTEKEYCKRKKTQSDSYKRVKKNVFDLSNYIFKNKLNTVVYLRINVDKYNYKSAKNFVDEIKRDRRYKNNIIFYLGRLRDSCHEECSSCYSIDEFEDLNMDFKSFLGEKINLPHAKRLWCSQCGVNCYCIGPLGEIYKCEHDFGVKNCKIGSVFSGLYYNKYFYKFMNMELPKRCKDCKLYPICLGGCQKQRLLSHNNSNCEYTLNHVKEIISQYVIKHKN